jgi:hypothetical protein
VIVDIEAGKITTDIVKLLERIEILLQEYRQSALSGPEVVRCLKKTIQALLAEFTFRDVHPVIRYRRLPNDEYAMCVRFLAYRDSFFWSHLKFESE